MGNATENAAVHAQRAKMLSHHALAMLKRRTGLSKVRCASSAHFGNTLLTRKKAAG
jgi:hypothetical protein